MTTENNTNRSPLSFSQRQEFDIDNENDPKVLRRRIKVLEDEKKGQDALLEHNRYTIAQLRDAINEKGFPTAKELYNEPKLEPVPVKPIQTAHIILPEPDNMRTWRFMDTSLAEVGKFILLKRQEGAKIGNIFLEVTD